MGAREGWYSGLSSAFLGVKAPKVLMLAGTDRLDRTLTVGQMQGKFQMVLLPQVISLYLALCFTSLCIKQTCTTSASPVQRCQVAAALMYGASF